MHRPSNIPSRRLRQARESVVRKNFARSIPRWQTARIKVPQTINSSSRSVPGPPSSRIRTQRGALMITETAIRSRSRDANRRHFSHGYHKVGETHMPWKFRCGMKNFASVGKWSWFVRRRHPGQGLRSAAITIPRGFQTAIQVREFSELKYTLRLLPKTARVATVPWPSARPKQSESKHPPQHASPSLHCRAVQRYWTISLIPELSREKLSTPGERRATAGAALRVSPAACSVGRNAYISTQTAYSAIAH